MHTLPTIPAVLGTLAAFGLIAGTSAPPARAADRSGGFARQLDEDRWRAAYEVPGVAVALVATGT